jgi:uncharacterized membrane protein YgcG
MAEEKENKDYKEGIEDLTDNLQEYLKTSAELYKMQATAKGAELGAEMIIGIIAGVFLAMGFLFASFAAAYSISDWLGKQYSGFLVVAVLYALLATIILLLKGRGLKASIADFIVKQIYGKDHE